MTRAHAVGGPTPTAAYFLIFNFNVFGMCDAVVYEPGFIGERQDEIAVGASVFNKVEF